MKPTNPAPRTQVPGPIVDLAWLGPTPFLDPYARRRRDPEASL